MHENLLLDKSLHTKMTPCSIHFFTSFRDEIFGGELNAQIILNIKWGRYYCVDIDIDNTRQKSGIYPEAILQTHLKSRMILLTSGVLFFKTLMN